MGDVTFAALQQVMEDTGCVGLEWDSFATGVRRNIRTGTGLDPDYGIKPPTSDVLEFLVPLVDDWNKVREQNGEQPIDLERLTREVDTRSRRQWDDLSVDGGEPLGELNGKYAVHTPDNAKIVEQSFNFGKGTRLVGAMVMVAWYMIEMARHHNGEKPRNAQELDALEKAIVDALATLVRIRNATPYLKASRVNVLYTNSFLPLLQEECRSGQEREGRPSPPVRPLQAVDPADYPPQRQETIDQIEAGIRDLEATYVFVVERDENGVPIITSKHTIPRGYNFDLLIGYGCQRYNTMV